MEWPKLEHRTDSCNKWTTESTCASRNRKSVVIESEDEEKEVIHSDETKLNSLIESNNISEAFFLARVL